MEKPPGKGLFIAYVVVAILVGVSMFFSASGKLMLIPGAVKMIHEDIGVPLSLFPVLAALLIAGGIGLLAGIFWPKVGMAAAAGLVLYFASAIVAHILIADWAGLKAPILPFIMSVAALTLRIASSRKRPA